MSLRRFLVQSQQRLPPWQLLMQQQPQRQYRTVQAASLAASGRRLLHGSATRESGQLSMVNSTLPLPVMTAITYHYFYYYYTTTTTTITSTAGYDTTYLDDTHTAATLRLADLRMTRTNHGLDVTLARLSHGLLVGHV